MNRIKNMFTNPAKGLVLALIYLATIVFIGLALFLVLTGKEEWLISYIVYGIAAVLLAYSVYVIVITFPRIKLSILKLMERREFTNKLLKNYEFRTIAFAFLSFFATILFAIFQAVMGIIDLSIWFGALAVYYIILSIMRGINLHKIYKKEIEEEAKIKLYRSNGYMLVVLTFIFFFAVVQMVFGQKGFEHLGLMIYVSAVYTFYKITLSVFNIFKARKQKDFNIQTIRNVNLADALVSIVALQTAMFHSFAEGDINTSLFNAATGSVVCILIISIGILMIVNAKKKLNKEDIENAK